MSAFVGAPTSEVVAPPWPIDSTEGRRLAASMPPEGQRLLSRWRYPSGGIWEAQRFGHFCAPASAVATMRFFRVDGPGLSQDAVYKQVVVPRGLFTKGVSFEHGRQMMQILSGGLLDVQAWSSRSHPELSTWLREDLTALARGEELCLLANYWRPVIGGGHWSPLGGFAEGKVLILDTNADRNPPQWMPLEWLVEGLCRHNDTTGLPRGYLVVKLRKPAVCSGENVSQ